jgi:hypothetical protein
MIARYIVVMFFCFFSKKCEHRVSKALYFSREPWKPLFRGNPRNSPPMDHSAMALGIPSAFESVVLLVLLVLLLLLVVILLLLLLLLVLLLILILIILILLIIILMLLILIILLILMLLILILILRAIG